MKGKDLENMTEQKEHFRENYNAVSGSRIKDMLSGLTASFLLGWGLGAIGKHTGHNEIPAVPIVMDMIGGFAHPGCYLFYGAGVALNYVTEIYQALQNCNIESG